MSDDPMQAATYHRSQQDRVLVLAVSRNPSILYQALRTELQPIMQSLINAGLRPELPCGTLMLVHPHQYKPVELMAAALSLKRSDLVVSAELEGRVADIISRIKEKVRITGRRPVPLGSLLHARNQKMPVMVKHTFLTVDSASSQRAEEATASTTDADRRKGPPPRKHYAS